MLPHADARAQAGYALLELTLALLIAGLLAAWGAQTLMHRFNDAQAQSAAVWMQTIHKALMAYVQRHGAEIQEAAAISALSPYGFSDWRGPTVPELVQAGFLSAGTPLSHRLTGPARMSVWRKGNCPGDTCAVEALVHGERPMLHAPSGLPDEAMIAQWLLAAKGHGAAVHMSDPDRIRGAAFAFSNVLYDGTALPSGTVGMAVTGEHLARWSYLRVRDRRDPDFQGSLSVAGDMAGGGDASLAGQLVIGAHHADGTPCAPNGAVAHEHAGGLLVCRDYYWRSSSRTGGGGYGYNSLYGCETLDGVSTANPLTGSCGCPWYAAAVRILDTGPRPYPEGRQQAYLCVG